jgi:IS605 OrfB family transposase
MIKAHPRTKSGYLRRTSRVYLTGANAGKIGALREFLSLYFNVVNYFIEFFWSSKDFTAALAEKFITSRAVNRFKITARLAQCAAKQAKEIVRSQKERKIKTMPMMRRKVATLDSRFVTIESFKGAAFDLAMSFGSGAPKMTVPINATAHLNRLCQAGWQIGKSIRLGMDGKGVWIELILEKAKPALREEGKIIGMDRGFRKAFVTSDEQEIGAELRDLIKKKGKRSKTSYHHVKTEMFRALKRLKLDGVKAIVLEDLRNIKRGKRGTFSRQVNRLLSFWSTARAVEWLKCRCEELGIRVIFVSPYKTSQRCALCGKIDSKNRKGEEFKCVRCGHEDCADHNASENLEFLGLAGIYSFRSLQTS